MPYEGIWILIPAYKPDDRLPSLIKDLSRAGFLRVAVVDDGGGADYAGIFEKAARLGAKVLTHPLNRGKGAAIKTGLEYIAGAFPGAGVITADADGQHRIGDIIAMAEAARLNPDALILGIRDKKLMPPRSRAGNTLTCFFFGITTGLWIKDTQTGLRALPGGALRLFSAIAGERYEYEMNMLIVASRERIKVVEIPIETVYIDSNSSSHFDAVKDSARIYALLFRQFGAYAGSSLASMGVDYGAAIALRYFLPDNVAIPTYAARAASSLVNYLTNSRFVFKRDGENRFAVVKYYLLVAAVAFLQVRLIRFFALALSLPYLPSKILADGILFLINFNVQKAVVFRKIRLRHKNTVDGGNNLSGG